MKDRLDFEEVYHLMHLLSIDRGNRLRYIEIAPGHEDLEGFSFLRQAWDLDMATRLMTQGIADPQATTNTFENLQGLRLKRMVMDGVAAEEPLRTSIGSDCLASFDINFKALGHNEPMEGEASCRRLRDFAWLRGARSIRSLGVANFRFRRYAQSEADLPLLGFLASFPNLETLEIRSEYYEDAELCSLIIEVIKNTTLKEIYHNIKGAPFDYLRKAAEEVGLMLVWGERTRSWPVTLNV